MELERFGSTRFGTPLKKKKIKKRSALQVSLRDSYIERLYKEIRRDEVRLLVDEKNAEAIQARILKRRLKLAELTGAKILMRDDETPQLYEGRPIESR